MKKAGLFLGVCAMLVGGAATTVYAADDGPTIQMIVMSLNSEYWLNVQAGAEAELEKSGGELIYTGPSLDGDIQGQVDLMQNAISSGVDGIILIPVDSEGLAPSVEQAEDAGIPVVVVDGPVDTDKVTSYIATDNEAGGRLAMETLMDLMGGEGKAVIVNALAGIPSNDGRGAGAEEAAAENSGIELLETLRGSDQAAALQNVENVLTANSDLKGIFSAYDRGAIGASQAVINAGLQDQIYQVAFDATADEIQYLEDGVIDALIVQQPYEMGRLAVEYINKALNGEEVPAETATDVVVVTKDNMNDPDIQAVLYPLEQGDEETEAAESTEDASENTETENTETTEEGEEAAEDTETAETEE